MKKPNLFEYLDVCHYLKDFYKFRKCTEPGFSYEAWSNEMSIRSRSYLRALVLKEKPIHESILPQLIKGLSLKTEELVYFDLLFRYNSVQIKELKNSYGTQLVSFWKKNTQESEIQDVAEFLADPINPVVFTYLSFDDSPSGFDEMCKNIGCEPLRLQNAIRCLVWQKLIDGIVEADGKISYKTVQPFFRVPSLPNNQLLKAFHIEGLSLAQEASHLPSEQRKYFSTFIAMSEEELLSAQTMIEEFNQQIMKLLNNNLITGKKIYRMNVQVFPVSNEVIRTSL